MFKNAPRNQGYELAPPPYEADSSRRFSYEDEENIGDDMIKETVANSSVEIRMRLYRLLMNKSIVLTYSLPRRIR